MEHLVGKTVRDASGGAIGTVTDVITDNQLQPQLITIKTGHLLGREHLAPIEAVELDGDELRTSFSHHDVVAAPTTRNHIVDDRKRTAVYEHFHIQPHAA